MRIDLSLPSLSLALFLLGAAGCSRHDPPHPRNVVFVLVDTLRADHLGAYGYARDTSPRFDAFAAGSLLFTNNRSQASCTFPSVNSMMTSRAATAFLGQPGGAHGIPEAVPSLPRLLAGQGFRTAAVSTSLIVRKSPSRFNPTGGFDGGFEVFDESCALKSAACVFRRAEEHLRSTDPRPFFLYLHFLDPHGPYRPPRAHVRRFATVRPEKPFIRNGNPDPIGEHLYRGAPDPGVTPADLQHLIDLYDEEIVFFDGIFGELLRTLEETGKSGETIVVFASDHGEEFLEHGHIKHCRMVYDTLVRVPLALRIPGVPAARLDAPVRNLDILPTLLDYLGIPPPPGLEGESLRGLVERGAPGPRHQFASQGSQRMAADGRFKLIHDLEAKSYQLFHLEADPGETRDVLAENRRDFFRTREALAEWMAETEGRGVAESLRAGREAEEKLRSLGYIE